MRVANFVWNLAALAACSIVTLLSAQQLPAIPGEVAARNLVGRVEPVCPLVARSGLVRGTVRFSVVVTKEGTVEGLQLISGHPLLAAAAAIAVRQWKYKPFLSAGAPQSIQTEVTTAPCGEGPEPVSRPSQLSQSIQQVFLGDREHPIVSGGLWLVVNGWGAYPGVLVATIQSGSLQIREGIQLPLYWEQADSFTLITAISNKPASKPNPLEVDAYGYSMPDYLKPFPTIYLSKPMKREANPDWQTVLKQTGHFVAGRLILPVPHLRKIRLLYPDDKPLLGRGFSAYLFGSSSNHCGVAVGIPLGEVKTDAKGEISIVATNSPLVVGTAEGYYEEMSKGPAGKEFWLRDYLELGSEDSIVARKHWTLPEYDYTIRLLSSDRQPVIGAKLNGCSLYSRCGDPCGPMDVQSDLSGSMHFTTEDLRTMQSVTVIAPGGPERELTAPEMKQLLIGHRLNLTLP